MYQSERYFQPEESILVFIKIYLNLLDFVFHI